MAADWNRPLTPEEQHIIAAARAKAYILYEGVQTPHRSCGIALAESFGLEPRPYQALRKGGVTGGGECGSIVAGRLILGEIFGDPDPTGPITSDLREAMHDYEMLWRERIDRGHASPGNIVCNHLTGQFAEFGSPERARFCTTLAAEVAALCAEVVLRHGGKVTVDPPVLGSG